uniref:testis-expressed protein 33 n=1 Tax=Ictidomys tridecemlineatus TaxID=43179 RepID=UPI001A9FCDA5|nr:testis-expressed protein 33 [Ictidomys tridecemlineatus]
MRKELRTRRRPEPREASPPQGHRLGLRAGQRVAIAAWGPRAGPGCQLASPAPLLPPPPSPCLCPSSCSVPLFPPVPLSLPPSGATTLAHLNNQEAQKDAVPWGAACNALDPSRFKYQVPLSPRGAQGSSLECGHPEVPPPPPSAASREPLCMDPPPRALRGGTEGAQPNEGPKSRTQEHRGAPASRKSSAIPENICHKFGSKVVDQLVSEEQVSKQGTGGGGGGGLLVGTHREGTEEPASESPWQHLVSTCYVPSAGLGSNSSQSGMFPKDSHAEGPPQETKSLMKASYTPEVIEKSVRDVGHWHGRRTDDLGRWHQKNAMNMNLQKALEEKYGEKSKAKNLKF